MAEEVKEETVEETPTDDTTEETSETTSEGSSIESSSEVTTEPTVEDNNQTLDLVQLEQRITSLEQRLLSVETPQAQSAPTVDGSDPNGEPEVAEESAGQDGDSRDDDVESTDDIKKILDL